MLFDGLVCKHELISGVMLVELHTGQPLLPGKSDLDMLALIMELLGELPTRLLNDGHYTSLFFLQKGECSWKCSTFGVRFTLLPDFFTKSL